MNSHEVFIHIHQGCFAGTGAIVRLPQCQWSKPDGYGKISQCITTTKHSKAKTVCIFLGIYCTSPVRASYGCLSWVIWRKMTVRYRERTVRVSIFVSDKINYTISTKNMADILQIAMGPIDNKLPLVQVTTSRRTGDRPLAGAMLIEIDDANGAIGS